MVTMTSGGARRVVGQGLGKLPVRVEPPFAEDVGDNGVDRAARLRTRGANLNAAVRVVLGEHRRGDGTTGVVDADVKDLGHLRHDGSDTSMLGTTTSSALAQMS